MEALDGHCIHFAERGLGRLIVRFDSRVRFAYGGQIMINVVAGIIALALLGYLTVSLLKPEWF
jgi:K+-transporting ATPase KdpF subunit